MEPVTPAELYEIMDNFDIFVRDCEQSLQDEEAAIAERGEL